VYHGEVVRQRIFQAAAIVVVCVFASLPTLTRVYDRLSTHDDVGRFRLSKNLERPHEKITAVGVAAPAIRVANGPAWNRSLVDLCPVVPASGFCAPLGPRAPPAR
jgi:hypothetical protein